ncbi:MAG TPA: hypothetical protein VH413_17950 [Verrucomicrobiae bacterium]|jgi:hypothetical protein|nr:hypothetical protein [Verrucomicrobiae bacterium]
MARTVNRIGLDATPLQHPFSVLAFCVQMPRISIAMRFLISCWLGCILVGCASSTAAWNNRIGKYTLSQARTELGKPNSEKSSPDGGTSIEWLTHPAGPPPTTGFAGALRVGGVDQDFRQPMPQQSRSEYLRLTFDSNGVLENWSRVYR